MSLTNSDIAGQGRFVGLQNYIELIRDQDFWASVGHTLYFVLLTVVPNTAVGFLLALLVVRLKRLRLPILSAFFLPFVLPVSVVTTAALWILDTISESETQFLAKKGRIIEVMSRRTQQPVRAVLYTLLLQE